MKKRNYFSDIEDRNENAFSVIADFEGNEEPVSYTHLSVYGSLQISINVTSLVSLRQKIVEIEH